MTCMTLRSIQLLDQVVCEFESGRIGEAVLLLAGMLDAAATSPDEIAIWRHQIARHPAGRFLGHQDAARLADPAPAGLSAWERQLHAAVSQLGFARGLKARRELGARAIETAWQSGQRIALLDCGDLGELDRLRGRPLENIVLVHSDRQRAEGIASAHVPPLTILDPAAVQGRRFDLLLASADRWSLDELAARLTAAAALLAPGASLLISAFAPGHLGAGWQAVCIGEASECHDENSLTTAARAADLAITHCRDSSGSLVWAVLQQAAEGRATSGEPTWISPSPYAL